MIEITLDLSIRTCFPIAAAAVSDKAEEINKLNVFPVPDGDTGTNMSLTLASVTKELSALPADADMEAIAGAITHGSLMGARGNSGVITSQILRGVAEGLVSADEPITSANIAFAFRRAVKVAFQAVRKPIEGTILTVLRDVSTKADECEKKKFSAEDALDAIEYATGDAETTKWGAERAKNGHPAPFTLDYIEVGNENHSAMYAKYYNRFYKRIREAYPDLSLIHI